jgi:hypothetical protein
MPEFVPRALLVAVTLWLASCGAGGNNNIFDLHGMGRGARDSTVLRLGVQSASPRAAAVGSFPVSAAANGNRGAGFTTQS